MRLQLILPRVEPSEMSLPSVCLSWPKNVIHSGICWSARIARKNYHPERQVMERMCIFGQYILRTLDHDLTVEENPYIIYPVSYRLQDMHSSFGPLGMVTLRFVQEEQGPFVFPEAPEHGGGDGPGLVEPVAGRGAGQTKFPEGIEIPIVPPRLLTT